MFLLYLNSVLLYAHGIADEQIAHLTYHIEHFFEEEEMKFEEDSLFLD